MSRSIIDATAADIKSNRLPRVISPDWPWPEPQMIRGSIALCHFSISRDTHHCSCQIKITVQRLLTCHTCGSPLSLVRTGVPHYCWKCLKDCIPAIDTGVPIEEPLDNLQPDESGTVEFNASHFFPPLTKNRIATAKVHMAQILQHFIECNWGGCYNNLYINVLVPHLDSPEVVDYILKGDVVHASAGLNVGKNGAKIYPELLRRLQGVNSSRIHAYLDENFGH